MSWAAHDPEGYNEVVAQGIAEKALQIVKDLYGEVVTGKILLENDSYLEKEDVYYLFKAFIKELQLATGRAAYDAVVELSVWAEKEVSEATSEYFISKASL